MEEKQPQQSIVSQEPAKPDKLNNALASVVSSVPTVAAKSPGLVLPVSFYEGASQLIVTSEENERLKMLVEACDDEISIRPDGLPYIEHMFYRRALTAVFGPGQWALLPASDMKIITSGDNVRVFRTWILRVRGKFIGEAEGMGSYYSNNAKQDESDAMQSAESNALMRICAKGSLGIGVNPWNRSFRRRWLKEWAVKVWVKTQRGNEVRWRRKDDEPFDGEIGLVKDDAKQTPIAPIIAPRSQAAPISPPPAKPPVTTAASSGGMANEGNWRLLVATARRAKMIGDKDDAKELLAFLCSTLDRPLPEMTGKTMMELCHTVTLEMTLEQFSRSIATLRERVKKAQEVRP